MTEREKLIDALWLKHGSGDQLNQIIEECAELIVAVRHHMRGKATMYGVLKEAADVQCMLEQLFQMYATPQDVKQLVGESFERARLSLNAVQS